jgi:hypothetical protein
LELEPAFFNVKVMFNFIMTAQIHMLSALERLKNDDSTHEFRNRLNKKLLVKVFPHGLYVT